MGFSAFDPLLCFVWLCFPLGFQGQHAVFSSSHGPIPLSACTLYPEDQGEEIKMGAEEGPSRFLCRTTTILSRCNVNARFVAFHNLVKNGPKL